MGTSERKTLEPIGFETTKGFNVPYLDILEVSVGDIQEKIKTRLKKGKFISIKEKVKDKLILDVKVFTNKLDKAKFQIAPGLSKLFSEICR